MFLQQNGLDAKSLLSKLVDTKQASNPGSDSKISLKFFAKFLKAKVDKKPNVSELLVLVEEMDIDHDGVISESDLDSFLGRVNYTQAFKPKQP